ncbi:MAG TPA: secretin N-terminal domain-containing protein [Candidatus Omnitrophota bacterium]|nr:secretin and TonB N-terminal domain-containing protein [Candidatus Omnitrophota bacterium]HQO58370.1 secretin N-terminal domain-containing protein [Candidatus Omnitrophota bacterium]HQP11510.1 secretin N-terminal domain-containing protein [Candidatus Omnitrophota bacterium]
MMTDFNRYKYIACLAGIFFCLAFSSGTAAERQDIVNQALNDYEVQSVLPNPAAAGVSPAPGPSDRVAPVSRMEDIVRRQLVKTDPRMVTADFLAQPVLADPGATAKDFSEEGYSQVIEIRPPADTREEKAPQKEEDTEEDLIDVLQMKNVDIMDILKLIAQKSGMNIITGKGVSGNVSVYLKNVQWKDALRIILDSNGLAYKNDGGILHVMPAAEFEKRYGYRFGGDLKTRIVHLDYADAQDMVTLLTQMKSYLGKIIFEAKSGTLVLTDSGDVIAEMEELIRKIDVPVTTKVYELNYAQAEDLAQKVAEVLTKSVGQVKHDARSNKLIVRDTPVSIEGIDKLVYSFDVREQQVLIEAKILQVVLSDEYKFGVDWEAVASEYHNLNFKSNFSVLNTTDKSGTMTVGTLENDDYTALMEALKTIGETNILSSPRITALNNQEARILVGSQEPYVTTTTTTPASGPTTTAESISFIDVGIKLYVTPTIHRDDFITMKIRPEVSSVTRTLTTSNNNSIPVVETSEAETMVMIKDGVTVIIGGLIKEEQIDSENKVPLLGDIPFLGHAFRNEDHLTRKTEIVIFLTPRLMSGDVSTALSPEDFSSQAPASF